MATSKTLTPTNVTISIPEFTDQPDQRVNSNCIDKLSDAVNALNSKFTTQGEDILGNGHIKIYKSGNVVTIFFWWATKAEVTGATLAAKYRPQTTAYYPIVALLNGSTYAIDVLQITNNGGMAFPVMNASAITNVFSAVTYVV